MRIKTLIDDAKLAIINARMAFVETKIIQEETMNATANGLLAALRSGQVQSFTLLTSVMNLCTNGFNLAKQFYEWSGMDRVLRIITFISNLNALVFLCNDVIGVVLRTFAKVVQVFIWTDYKGEKFDFTKYIGTSIENFFKSILGAGTVEEIEKIYNSANRIYQSAANVLTALQGISNSTLRACGVINNQLGDMAKAMKSWGLVGKKAYLNTKKNINFQNPIFTTIQTAGNQIKDMAKDIDWVASSVKKTIDITGREVSKIEKIISDETERFNAEYQTEAGESIPDHAPTTQKINAAKANSQPKKYVSKSVLEILRGLAK